MTGDRRTRRQRGQAMTEFALVALPFFFLLFSIIEFGRVVYSIQMLNNAAREGARYAIVHGSESGSPSGPMPGGVPNSYDLTGLQVGQTVKKHAIAIIDSGPADYAVTVKWCATAACPDTNSIGQGDGTNARSQTVKVEVRYHYRPLMGMTPVPPFILTGGSTLVVNH